MNQRTYLGTTYLDVAKGAVEVFMKVKNDFTPTFFSKCAALEGLGFLGQDWSKLIYVVLVFFFWQLRARDPASRGDRYMLVTFDDPPYGVKVISNDTIFTFDKSTVFFCHWDFIVLLVCSQCWAASRWRKTAIFLLQIPADPELHCLRPSSGHFAFVLRKVSGVEMEAERFIIAYDVALFLKVQCVDWWSNPPIIVHSSPYIIHALPLVNLVWKLISPLHEIFLFIIF